MNFADEIARRQNDFNRIAVQILLTDLDLGLTFAKIAAGPYEPEIRARNIANARSVYETISNSRPSVSMEEKDALTFADGLQLLKDRLSELGELFE